jgi:S-methylmethionine-dependent homocysteine/selenocysteine methylase
MGSPLAALLRSQRPVILDGALGSELERRGIDTGLPLWSARPLLTRPDAVRTLHEDYLRAGADIIATCTFRTTRRTFLRAGLPDRSAECTALAVNLARDARERTGTSAALIGGSMGPLEDCYRPDLVPSEPELRDEHREHAGRLAAAGVDVLLIETIGTTGEARIASEAARATGLEFVLSFLGGDDGTLFGGEHLSDAVRAVVPFHPTVICVNCVAARHIERHLSALLSALGGIPPGERCAAGVYANAGLIGGDPERPMVCDVSPAEYAQLSGTWAVMGARLIGGCCGTGPDHIARLRSTVV